MPPLWNTIQNLVRLLVNFQAAGRSQWAAAILHFRDRSDALAGALRQQQGFSLLEAIAATGIIGISVVGSVMLLSTTVRTSDSTQGNLGLVQLIRSQVESIQNAPYKDDPSQYPLIPNIPSDVSIKFESTDPGTRYQVNGFDQGQVIQQIEVTGIKDEKTASLTFYKIKRVGLPTPTPGPSPATDTLEFDTIKGQTADIISISGNVYAVAYAGNGDDGFLKTLTIATNGQITDVVIDTLEFDSKKGAAPNMIPISGDVYAIAYAGDGDDGFLKTVTVAANGQIGDSVIDTLEYDNQMGTTPDMIPISGNVYAIAYAGNGDDGFLKTVQIAANGQITNTVIDTLEFDPVKGRDADIIPISGDVYAIAYTGDSDDGFLKTVTIAADGQITDAVIDTLEFDAIKGVTPQIVPVSGNVYAIAFAGSSDDGFLKTVTIAKDGQITDAVIDTLEFDALKGETANIIPVSGDVYAVAYSGSAYDGFLKTFTIASSGQITDAVIDSLEFDNRKGTSPNIIQISGTVYAIAYGGDGDDGYLKTIAITTGGLIQP